jgi:hypothetical protein
LPPQARVRTISNGQFVPGLGASRNPAFVHAFTGARKEFPGTSSHWWRMQSTWTAWSFPLTMPVPQVP